MGEGFGETGGGLAGVGTGCMVRFPRLAARMICSGSGGVERRSCGCDRVGRGGMKVGRGIGR